MQYLVYQGEQRIGTVDAEHDEQALHKAMWTFMEENSDNLTEQELEDELTLISVTKNPAELN